MLLLLRTRASDDDDDGWREKRLIRGKAGLRVVTSWIARDRSECNFAKSGKSSSLLYMRL